MGGWGVEDDSISSAELFPPTEACSIPALPQPREGHSLSLLSGGRLVVCGGFDSGASKILDSCIHWLAGNTGWTPLHRLYVMR